MFKRLRQLPISLAAKCQLLFGAAVVLIIMAALFWPWWRMEQLTEQIDERAARALVEHVAAEHAREHADRPGPIPRAPELGVFPTTQRAPTTASTRRSAPSEARLILPPEAESKEAQAASALTPFERFAVAKLTERPTRVFVARAFQYPDGGEGFRYAQVVADCARCHVAANATFAETGPGPSTAPHEARAAIGLVAVEMPSQVQPNQLLLNRVFILTAGLLAGTLAIIVFYLITTRLILQPVRVLQETAEKVSEGDLNIRSDINTGDEFQQLSETFNTMLANLKQGADQLRAINKSLDLKLGQLAESNLALYESNRLKSEFLANVSHELRTPLNSILGFAELLKDGVAADPKSQRYVQNILGSGRNLLELINDLLDLAKIEAGRMDVRAEPVSLADLFEGLVSLLKPIFEAKQVAIFSSVATGVPILRTDAAKLQQVLYNFLSNAIKYSPPGGRIDLAAQRAADQVRISVTDQGPGIDPSQHAVIFEKFRQLDAGVTRQHGGTGLGLAISKELTTLLGGAIGVESSAGQGATFWVTLPDAATPQAQETRGELVSA